MTTSDIKTIHSVGIDIGTTTSQVIFSALQVMNRAPAARVPRYEFVDRRILYVSPVRFTPLLSDGTIDEKTLSTFILDQYRSAGLERKDVETGAIIITGETSRAQNARAALLRLADELGDFIVATAGPHLEAVIAGRGSGAAAVSEARLSRVVNIDIGGGTSNYAVFDAGKVDDTACLNVGARLVETDEAGSITRIHPPAEPILQTLFPGFNRNFSTLSHADLRRIAMCMADLIVECLQGRPSPLARRLLMTDPLREGHAFDAVFLSGGVGACFADPQPGSGGLFRFRDLGPLLASALREHRVLASLPVQTPRQTIRATVIGAGAYSLTLSGSTIWISYDRLPVRNVPVVHPAVRWIEEKPPLFDAIVEAARRMDLDLAHDPFAVALAADMPVTYRAVAHGADELTRLYHQYPNDTVPAIVLSCNDIGKALGMELEPRLRPKPLAVVDEVQTHEGDYVDIGRSYFGGEIVPLSVKSLAFPV